MSPFIVPIDPNATPSVRIDRTAAGTGTVAPTIAVGQVLQVTVSNAPGSGKGNILLGGTLIPAELPANLQVGDRLVAQVTAAGREILFKILEIQRPQVPLSETALILNSIEEFLKESVVTGLRATAPFPVSSAGTDNTALLPRELAALMELLKNTDNLSDANTVRQYLTQFISDKDTLSLVQRALASVKETLSQALPNNSDRLLFALLTRLSEFPDNPPDAIELRKSILTLLQTVSKELQGSNLPEGKGKELLRRVETALQQALSQPESLPANLNALRDLLQPYGQTAPGRVSIGGVDISRLQAALVQMETALQSQINLSQLNPLMQALGEPTFVLFPFLFQGLLLQGELLIDADSGKKKSADESTDRKKRKKKESPAPYHRVKVHVPLPTMGAVAVDIAHRDREIYVSFSVDDEGVGKFLEQQLEFLLALLSRQGFEKAELVANIGSTRTAIPDWIGGIEASMSIIA